MITFLDGPAVGQSLMLRRSPVVLRVVITPRGKLDALDQPDDVAAANERIHVYRLASRPTRMHLRGRGISGFYAMAEYRQLLNPPAEEITRDNAAWARWCVQNEQRIRTELAADGVELTAHGGRDAGAATNQG